MKDGIGFAGTVAMSASKRIVELSEQKVLS